MFLKNLNISTPEGKKELIQSIYISQKVFFILCALVFFGMYFCISSGYARERVTPFFLYQYVVFILSFSSFLGAALWYFGYGKIPTLILGILSSIPLALLSFFLYFLF